RGHGMVGEDGCSHYKLSSDSIKNIFTQADANFAHNIDGAQDLKFAVKYEITDHAQDGSGLTETVVKNAVHEIIVTPVTDQAGLETEPSTIESRGEFNVGFTVSKLPDGNVASNEPDYDGSERFT